MKTRLVITVMSLSLLACNGNMKTAEPKKRKAQISENISDSANTKDRPNYSERSNEFKELESHIPRYYIKYKQPVNGYTVKVMVESIDEPSRAILEFSKEDKIFILENRYFYEPALKGNKNKIYKNGVYYIDYIIKRNARFPGDLDKGAPFFFQDVDFDNTQELIFALWGEGQRGSNIYEVYPIYECGSENLSKISNEPFNLLDDFTEFDQRNKTITLSSNNGCDNYTKYVYKLDECPEDYFFPLKKVVDNVDGKVIEYKIKVVTRKK